MLKKLVVGAIAAGTVAAGAAGVAVASGSASPSTATPVSAVVAANPSTGAVPATGAKHARTFTCAKAPTALQRIATVEARISAGLPKLHSAEQRATAAGNTTRAARIEKRITRLESPSFQTRLQRVTQRIEQSCHVSSPSTGSATGSTASA